MKLATLASDSPDGQLVIVSKDNLLCVDASNIAPNLLAALSDWEALAPKLDALYQQLNAGEVDSRPFDPKACVAPLPRTFQWCDGSAFLNHGRLMEKAFGHDPLPDSDKIPLMYQGASDDFLGPHDPVPMADDVLGIDFEGEFGVIVGEVPMGVSAEEAERHIKLVVQLNDWSLRGLGPREMKTGFGFLQAKPSTSFAPIAITPDELGDCWANGRVKLDLNIQWNQAWFGNPNGAEMNFSFGELIAHAARTRKLSAGTLIGSGTVSNENPERGSACIAERRVLEILNQGEPTTTFMDYGDRVSMVATTPEGNKPFGEIEQEVVRP